ncbi:MAG: TIGR04283 family arsenosugar biosynthesis glycosyltransferase [Bacteroidota bacterium]|jgi:rSAM/selenodomain-associated transferase 2|nr:TIGR04283 family arsenosugar biosynthesis glycosyltransferase [Hyphomicrobiaceae bacterium]
MISVVVPTLNAETHLAASLTALVPATVEGLVREVVVVDGGSTDRTTDIVDQAGATLVKSTCGRGTQLAAGAEHTRLPWILFLHADTVLEPGWEREAAAFIERVDTGRQAPAAAAFRFALDEPGLKPRLVELGVALRCTLLRLPYGDQGLLIPRRLYQQVGGYRRIPLMEDVDLVRRLGRSRTVMLRARANTSALRYRRDGYLRRIARNLTCLTLYYLRVPAGTLARLYR